MANRNELTGFGEFKAGLFAKFAQCDFLNLLLVSIVIIELTGGPFPDRFVNRDAFLSNENNFTVTRHRRDYHGRFAMHDWPSARIRARGRLHMIGHNFQMRVSKMPLAGNGFPPAVLFGLRHLSFLRHSTFGLRHCDSQPTDALCITVAETYFASSRANFRSSMATF